MTAALPDRVRGWFMKHLPRAPITVAAGLAVAAGIAGWGPGEWLVFDRPAIIRGEAWRWLTAHFVHWALPHALANLAVLLPFWWIYETRRGSRATLHLALFAAASISAVLWWLEPALALYTGASGLACTGVASVGVIFASARPHPLRWAGMFLLASLIGKLVLESLAGWTFGPPASDDATRTVLLAHWAGALVGLAARRPGAAFFRDCHGGDKRLNGSALAAF
jgi:rhomboid family GlyGly-CTERM serine protease